MSQMAQLATLDGIRNLNDSFQDVLRLYELVSGTGLLGREVIYQDGDQVYGGQVESVSTAGDRITLTVNGSEVPLNKIERIL
jgi:flagellar hook assembly protein FlgD